MKKHALEPKSTFLEARTDQLFPLHLKNEETGLQMVEQIYEPSQEESVQGCEVYNNWMCLLVEKQKQK